MTGINVDSIAAPSADAWKPAEGETIKGTITFADETTGPSYDGDKTEQKLRIVINDGTDDHTIWAVTNTDTVNGGHPKRDARAIAAAVRASGATSLEVGGTLAVKRTDNINVDVKGKQMVAYTYVAEYQPPKAGAAVTDDQADGAVTGLL
jgi:hypothetical protein